MVAIRQSNLTACGFENLFILSMVVSVHCLIADEQKNNLIAVGDFHRWWDRHNALAHSRFKHDFCLSLCCLKHVIDISPIDMSETNSSAADLTSDIVWSTPAYGNMAEQEIKEAIHWTLAQNPFVNSSMKEKFRSLLSTCAHTLADELHRKDDQTQYTFKDRCCQNRVGDIVGAMAERQCPPGLILDLFRSMNTKLPITKMMLKWAWDKLDATLGKQWCLDVEEYLSLIHI